jgi:hypothetical protein
MVEYERKEWLEEAILEYVGNNEGVDSVDVVSHFKLRCDTTLMSLRYLVDSGKISETQPYMKFEYRLNKYNVEN